MRKWVFLFVFLILVFGIIGYLSFGYYSEGMRGGFIIKLSKKGYVFKTYEGELKMGGMYEGEGTLNATQWNFSVSTKNKEAIDNLQKAIDTGHRVSITYEEKFFIFPWNGDTKFFVTKVEVLGEPEGYRRQQPFQQQQQQQQPSGSDTGVVTL